MNLSSKNKPNPNFSMSSMTDLIFILLIFFGYVFKFYRFFASRLASSSESSEQINKEDVNIVSIKKDDTCNLFQYTPNGSINYCDGKMLN